MLRLDHIAVSAEGLAEGVAAVEEALGVSLEPGGAHALMGTHNRLLSLGPFVYLEVIAVDPAAAKPAHPRWFGLDHFAGAPRLTNWICATDDIGAASAALPGSGAALSLSRGDFVWSMAVPPDGMLPFDGAQPALIEWETALHPAGRLPDRGCRLRSLTVIHPRASELEALLAPLGPALAGPDEPWPRFQTGDAPGFVAEIETPSGTRLLR